MKIIDPFLVEQSAIDTATLIDTGVIVLGASAVDDSAHAVTIVFGGLNEAVVGVDDDCGRRRNGSCLELPSVDALPPMVNASKTGR